MLKKIKILSTIVFLSAPMPALAFWDPYGLSFVTGLPGGSIMDIIEGIMNWLLIMLGIFGVIGFVISGIMYLVSAGDEDMLARAKKAMTWSIVGVIVGLIGVVIIQAVDSMLNAFTDF